MTSPFHYYEEQLYPLQDAVLDSFHRIDTDFFLTGGTALSRAYYSHRYSDDLDFFVNSHPAYAEQVETVFAKLKEDGFFWGITEKDKFIQNANFVSLYVQWDKSDAKLKLDFVNDRVPHFGEIQSTPLFHRVDPVRNILSNKLGALFRFAGKDVADIREIALHENFNWNDVFAEACQKDAGVEIPVVSHFLGMVPLSTFNEVIWQEPLPSFEGFTAEIKQIIHDMLNCGDNSLCSLVS